MDYTRKQISTLKTLILIFSWWNSLPQELFSELSSFHSNLYYKYIFKICVYIYLAMWVYKKELLDGFYLNTTEQL